MYGDAMRPDDLELLRRAGRNLRRAGFCPVVFGGLRHGDRIRISTTSGAETDRLKTIVITPERGLGGKSWLAGQLQAVRDYARSQDITHDFDTQIQAEGIVDLCVAPIIVRNRIGGLLYAGHRSAAAMSADDLWFLDREAQRIAQELHLRDSVDERVRVLRAREALTRRGGDGGGMTDLYDRLLSLADRTADPDTARELRSLLALRPEPVERECLTPRQKQIMDLVALGLTNEEIATRLSLSTLTVKSYLREAMSRLGARTRYQAVVEARHRGLIG